MLNLVFYTNKFISRILVGDKFAARTYAFIIIIKDTYKNDKGLLEHEKTHVRQFWKNPFLFGIRYRLSKSFRLSQEIEAYKVQMKYSRPGAETNFANYIIDKYGLGLKKEDTGRIIKMLLS